MEVKYGRGYVYALQYHVVWCVKYRRMGNPFATYYANKSALTARLPANGQ